MGLWQCCCLGIHELNPAVVVGVAGIASLLIAFAARGTLKRFSEKQPVMPKTNER